MSAEEREFRCPKCPNRTVTVAARAWCNQHPRLVAMTEVNPLPLTSQEPAA